MNNQIQEITQRHAEITPSPWREYMQTYVDDPESCYRSIEAGAGYYGVELEKAVGFCITGYISPEDASFISNAPEDIDYLLSEIEQLQEALEWYADKNNYDPEHLSKYGYIPIDKDEGKRARQSLSNLKG